MAPSRLRWAIACGARLLTRNESDSIAGAILLVEALRERLSSRLRDRARVGKPMQV